MYRKFGMTLVLLATTAFSFTACSESEEDFQPSLGSQPPPPAGQPPLGAPGQAPGQGQPNPLHVEFQQIQQRLGQAQQTAMADSSIAKKYAELETYLEGELKAADPEFEAKREQMQAIQAELAAAQQANDQETFQAIVERGNTLQAEMQRVQAETMQKENVVARMEAFRETLTARMTEIEPETPKLIERSTAIAAELQGP